MDCRDGDGGRGRKEGEQRRGGHAVKPHVWEAPHVIVRHSRLPGKLAIGLASSVLWEVYFAYCHCLVTIVSLSYHDLVAYDLDQQLWSRYYCGDLKAQPCAGARHETPTHRDDLKATLRQCNRHAPNSRT